MEKDSAVMQNTNYKLLDLMKFICAFLVMISCFIMIFQIMQFHSFMLAQDIF